MRHRFYNRTRNRWTYSQIFDTFRGKTWERYASNPILTKGTAGAWDSLGLRDPRLMIDADGFLVQESGNYIMYFSGYEDTGGAHYERAIGRATSVDGISWTKYGSNPVLDKGASLQWDDFGVQLGNVIKRGAGDYIMFYSGVDAAWTAWGIGVATSVDGISWTKAVGNPVLSYTDFSVAGNNIISFPYVILASDGNYYMVLSGTYAASPDNYKIFSASSADGTTWAALNSGNPVLSPQSESWDDDNVENSILIEVLAGKYALIYNANDHSAGGVHRVGMATSVDLINWTKYGDNPVLDVGDAAEWDDYRVERLFIAKEDFGSGTLRGWYNAAPTGDGEADSAIGYATCNQSFVGY